ncbi:hypothetical protein WJX81_001834 [Elliptochloris bilobata]|uniref:Cyclin n=1 Tax=Elliptochloris bilobata TaxID=381761 RepID=A0AAW1SJ95_9CHLO
MPEVQVALPTEGCCHLMLTAAFARGTLCPFTRPAEPILRERASGRDCVGQATAASPELVGSEASEAEVLGLLAACLEALVERRASGMGSSSSQEGEGSRAERISKYAKCSPACFAMAFSYMERVSQVDPAHTLTLLNVHRLLITAVLLAAKLTDDNFFNNAYFAKIGGITTPELNRLELQLLKLLDFRL